MTMKVGKLRNLLEEVLDTLEIYEEDQDLTLQGNTYFTRDNDYVLQTPIGFLGLDNIKKAVNGDDDDETEGDEDE